MEKYNVTECANIYKVSEEYIQYATVLSFSTAQMTGNNKNETAQFCGASNIEQESANTVIITGKNSVSVWVSMDEYLGSIWVRDNNNSKILSHQINPPEEAANELYSRSLLSYHYLLLLSSPISPDLLFWNRLRNE